MDLDVGMGIGMLGEVSIENRFQVDVQLQEGDLRSR